MNKTERTLAQALTNCRAIPNGWDIRFIQSMAWLASHEPKNVLSGPQRYNLHLMAFRYRRQLAGILDQDLIPMVPPKESDYVRPAPPQRQIDLLDGSAKVVEFAETLDRDPPRRQKRLF